MMKRASIALAMLCACAVAHAQGVVTQFTNGQVLTGAALNAMQQGFVNTSGGKLTNGTISGGTASGTDTTAADSLASGATTTRTHGAHFADHYNVLDFGAKCDGSTDDTAAFNAATTAAYKNATDTAQVVEIPPLSCAYAGAIAVPAHVDLRGQGLLSSKMVPTSASASIVLSGTSATAERFLILHNTQYSTGVDIDASTNTPFKARVSHVDINNPCIGVDISGNSIIVDHARIDGTAGASCYGIRVGHNTTAAETVDPRITDTTVASSSTAGAGMLIEDAGGLYLSNNDVIGGAVGTYFHPGVNQQITWTFGSNTVLGDTTNGPAALFDTADKSALIKSLSFLGPWASNAQSAQGINIKNTAGGTIKGVHFIGARLFTNGLDGVDVAASVTGFSFEHGEICGGGAGYSGIYLNPGVTKFRIIGNDISETCEGWSSNVRIGVNLGGSNDEGIVAENDLTGLTTAMAITSPPPTANLLIKNNLPGATQSAAIADAATLGLATGQETYAITGSGTSITDMTGAWNGRHVMLYSSSAQTFATGGTSGSAMCANYTSTANVPIEASYYGCWYLK